MEIEGTYTLQALPEEVWNCLLDEQTIQQTVPGLERLTKVDEQTYFFTLHIRHAPLRGNYTGHATILERSSPSLYHVQIEGEGQPNKFHCKCAIQLNAQNENTVVSYRGTIQLSRGNTRISAPLVKGTIKVLLQQFFTALTDQLRTKSEGLTYVTTLEEMYEMPFMEEQISEHLLITDQDKAQGFLRRLVHLLRLGQQNPNLEEQWERRLRQAGIVAALLLLVWVGTRLPRRPVHKSSLLSHP